MIAINATVAMRFLWSGGWAEGGGEGEDVKRSGWWCRRKCDEKGKG